MAKQVSRRTFVKGTVLTVAAATVATRVSTDILAAEPVGSRQASGVRIGETTATSAIVRVRLTQDPVRNNAGLLIPGKTLQKKPEEMAKVTVPVEQLEGACAGAAGKVRLRYAPDESLAGAKDTGWVDVAAATDFAHHFSLQDLTPGTVYYFASETAGPDGTPHAPLRGQFTTAPAADSTGEVRFCVMTCQGYPDRDHPDGHQIYPSMLATKPHFACMSGDLVYYDNDEPRANTPRLARFHWERMFSLPRLHEFTRQVGCYWIKDDHDTLKDDAWPGGSMSELTFEQGQQIFREQCPVPAGAAYRTVRWGRDLQIWITDGRDARSVNTIPDGPDKTIWGAEQKAWFKKTVAESTASFKILISPTPLVGPDRPRKNDNHANAGFQHEGDEIRAWLKANAPGLLVICGDRHWQYHSVHPQTGLNEFSVGAASDEHSGGTPGENKDYHKFHRVKGGFLSAVVKRDGDRPAFKLTLHEVDGKPAYEWSA